jgi:hypothetical protein
MDRLIGVIYPGSLLRARMHGCTGLVKFDSEARLMMEK